MKFPSHESHAAALPNFACDSQNCYDAYCEKLYLEGVPERNWPSFDEWHLADLAD